MTSIAESASPLKSISLFYRDGGSDKIYNAEITPEAEGYVVSFSYGRRGTALQAGRKTAVPVPWEKAEAIYEKLIAEKQSKGYTPQEGGALFAGGENAGRITGNVPQLLNATTEAELDTLLSDDSWCLQTKYDGKRIMIAKIEGTVEGSNRKGLVVALPQELVASFAQIPDGTVLDGELVGTTFYVFDATRWENRDLADVPYSERLEVITQLAADNDLIKRVETSQNIVEKTAHLERIRASHGEGVVLKRLDAPYRAGRPASGGNQRKFKFTESATCIVTSVSTSKRSVQVGVMEKDICRSVGSVTILPNFPIPAVGAFVEVTYLYYFESGSLYQPCYRGERDDKVCADAFSSLKRKPVDGEDEV
jgi:bifunctional non-homologous end joining protein LigD